MKGETVKGEINYESKKEPKDRQEKTRRQSQPN